MPPTETTALLPGSKTPWYKSHRYLLAVVCVSVVAADFGNALSFAPQMKIFESLICKQFLGRDPIDGTDDDVCKSSRVQTELALINGWKETFDQIPGILLALIYGLVADRVGRKPILLLALTGLLAEEIFIRLISWWSYAGHVPLRAVWLTPLFQIIGGGPATATSMAYSIITDSFPASKRASLYFSLAAAILVGEVVATPLSAALMTWSAWIPSLGGVACEAVGLATAALLPETKPDGDSSPETPSSSEPEGEPTTIVTRLKAKWHSIRENTLFNANFAFVGGAFLLANIALPSLRLVTQYASKRFSWTIAKASLLISLKGSINLVCLVAILPYLSRILSRKVSSARKDLYIVRGSVFCLTAGFIFMALATHISIFITGISILAFGSGFHAALRSFANSLGTPLQVGLINTSIGMSISVGSLVAGPIFAAAMSRGFELEGVWSGLLYIIPASLFLGATTLTWLVRLEKLQNQA